MTKMNKMDEKEVQNILNDKDRLNGQFGGTKDFIIDTCANRLVMASCQVALGTRSYEKYNLQAIKEDLENYDKADRYVFEKYRKEMYDWFKTQSLPLLMGNLTHVSKSGKLNPELWTPVLELFFEKALDYLSLGE